MRKKKTTPKTSWFTFNAKYAADDVLNEGWKNMIPDLKSDKSHLDKRMGRTPGEEVGRAVHIIWTSVRPSVSAQEENSFFFCSMSPSLPASGCKKTNKSLYGLHNLRDGKHLTVNPHHRPTARVSAQERREKPNRKEKSVWGTHSWTRWSRKQRQTLMMNTRERETFKTLNLVKSDPPGSRGHVPQSVSDDGDENIVKFVWGEV